MLRPLPDPSKQTPRQRIHCLHRLDDKRLSLLGHLRLPGTHILLGHVVDQSRQAQQHRERVFILRGIDEIEVVDLMAVCLQVTLEAVDHGLTVGMRGQCRHQLV